MHRHWLIGSVTGHINTVKIPLGKCVTIVNKNNTDVQVQVDNTGAPVFTPASDENSIGVMNSSSATLTVNWFVNGNLSTTGAPMIGNEEQDFSLDNTVYALLFTSTTVPGSYTVKTFSTTFSSKYQTSSAAITLTWDTPNNMDNIDITLVAPTDLSYNNFYFTKNVPSPAPIPKGTSLLLNSANPDIRFTTPDGLTIVSAASKVDGKKDPGLTIYDADNNTVWNGTISINSTKIPGLEESTQYRFVANFMSKNQNITIGFNTNPQKA